MVKIARSDDLRPQNRRLLLGALRQGGTLSRTELCSRTGLSAATVSTITSALLAEGILCPGEADPGSATGRRGRPQVALALNPMAATIGVAELAVNSVYAALIDYSGELVAETGMKLDTLSCGSERLVQAVIELLQQLVSAHPVAGNRLKHISLGVQGVTDAAGQSMLWSPITTCRTIPFGAEIRRVFSVPVTVSNDCSLVAKALRAQFPQRYARDFIAIMLSHGIGMGLFLNDRLFGGIRSSASEFGHMVHEPDGALCRCGRRGCIEAYAGDYAILRAAEGQPPDAPPRSGITGADIARLADKARAGSPAERGAFDAAGRAIGYGLASLFALIDPVPVAFVGSGSDAFDLMEPAIRAAIGRTIVGEAASSIEMECYPSEHPLIRQGCLVTGLGYLDRQLFAAGAANDDLTRKAG